MEYEDKRPLISEKLKESMAATTAEADMAIACVLQLQEIEKHEQERRDLELSQVARKKIKRDLSIRLHDHNFASKIAQIPDHDWQLYGHSFHEPYYGAGSSSSTKAEECFRLYFKGIVVNLSTINKLKKVGAIGVAICDPRDNVIFELSKNH